jgi:hypothetical protein
MQQKVSPSQFFMFSAICVKGLDHCTHVHILLNNFIPCFDWGFKIYVGIMILL